MKTESLLPPFPQISRSPSSLAIVPRCRPFLTLLPPLSPSSHNIKSRGKGLSFFSHLKSPSIKTNFSTHPFSTIHQNPTKKPPNRIYRPGKLPNYPLLPPKFVPNTKSPGLNLKVNDLDNSLSDLHMREPDMVKNSSTGSEEIKSLPSVGGTLFGPKISVLGNRYVRAEVSDLQIPRLVVGVEKGWTTSPRVMDLNVALGELK